MFYSKIKKLCIFLILVSAGLLSGCSNPEGILTKGYWTFQRVELPKSLDANLTGQISMATLDMWNHGQISKFDGNAQQRALGMIAEKRYGDLLAYSQLQFSAKDIIMKSNDEKIIHSLVDHYSRNGQIITAFVVKNGMKLTQTYLLTNKDQTLIQELDDGFKAIYEHHS